MKKRNKWLIGLGAVLAAYLLYPSSNPKIVEPVKIEKKAKRKHKIDFERINQVINQNKPEEINLEEVVEESNLPSCLQCEDWKPKVEDKWYKDGFNENLRSIKKRSCGELHGEQLIYYANGVLESSTNYFCGKKNGFGKEWWKNGRLRLEENYINGKLEGFQRGFNRNGRMYFETRFINGKEEGLDTWWYDDGEIKVKRNYVDGKLEGLKKEWNKWDGHSRGIEYNYSFLPEELQDNWIMQETYIETNYINGLEEGLQKEWWENGQLMMEKNYVNGKAEGLERYWSQNGNLRLEIINKNDKEISIKEWDEQGRLTVGNLNEKKK